MNSVIGLFKRSARTNRLPIHTMDFKQEMSGYWLRNTILKFGLKVYKSECVYKNGNEILAPAGLHHVISVLCENTDNGKVQAELLRILEIPASRHARNVLKLKWTGYILNYLENKQNFMLHLGLFSFARMDPSKRHFNELKNNFFVDFVHIDTWDEYNDVVNNWITTATSGHVKAINVGAPGSLALSVTHFEPSLAKSKQWSVVQDEFFLADNSTVMADFLETTQTLNYAYNRKLDATIVQLDYNVPDYKLIILMPENLTVLENTVTQQHADVLLTNCLEGLQEKVDMVIRFPKFIMNKELDVGALLRNLYSSQFISNVNQNFYERKNMYFRHVKQYNHLKVVEPELGACMETENVQSKPGFMNLKINRPFMFMLFDDHVLLYMGKICNPNE